MKRLVSVFTAAALAFSLSGCAANQKPMNETPNENQKSEEKQQQNQTDAENSENNENTQNQAEEEVKQQIREKAEAAMNDPKNAQKKKIFEGYSKFLKEKQYVGHYEEDTYGNAAGEILDYSYTIVNMNDEKKEPYLLVGIYKKWFNMTEFHLFYFDEKSSKVQYVEGDENQIYTRVLSSGGYSDAVGILEGSPGLFVMHKEKSSNHVTATGNKAKVEDIKKIDSDVNYEIDLCETDDLTALYSLLFDIEMPKSDQ